MMWTARQVSMQKQTLNMGSAVRNSAIKIRAMDDPGGTLSRRGSDWERYQTFRQSTFSLVMHESHLTGAQRVSYTQQEEYIKINFWLSGRHTTVLDGFGQHEHRQPEVFITSGPAEMIKVDLLHSNTRTEVVALCLLPEFFPREMDLSVDELPDPLRYIMLPQEHPYAFGRLPLTPELMAAARAILAAPFAVRREPLYSHAKAIELMCLLIHQLGSAHSDRSAKALAPRCEARVHAARELILEHYADELTIGKICKEVGLNRTDLTKGFRHLFGYSVYDYLQKVRMERAYELLKNEALSVIDVAAAVGYSHPCNFSTAFRAYFGCRPGQTRSTSAAR